MRILLTNDDGIDAPGLEALEAALVTDHEVWVCAPDGERSGTSHGIQIRGPVRIRQVANRRFSCGGSPADCVFLSHSGTFIPAFDLVVSGINRGPNIGTDTIYSGTCAAARQAVLLGIPALALSLVAMEAPWDYIPGADLVANRLEHLVSLPPPGHFLNINFPAKPVLPLQLRQARPCVRQYRDKVVEFSDPSGDLWCWVDGKLRTDDFGAETDGDIVTRGIASWAALPAQPAWTPVGGLS